MSILENKVQSISATDENPNSGNPLLLVLGNTVQTLRNEVNLLKQKQGTVLVKNCDDLFTDATMVSGNFSIDPDGSGPIDPFTVFCDTVKSMNISFTQIIVAFKLQWFIEILSFKARKNSLHCNSFENLQ